MKVLLLFDNYRFITDRLFFGFVSKLQTMCELKTYGPEIYEIGKTMLPMPKELQLCEYNEQMTGKDLIKEYNPDIIFLLLYNVKNLDWYPKDICKAGVPTVLLEDDHYTYNPAISEYKGTKPLEWYKSSGLSLLLRRHYYVEDSPIPSVWFPQSANEEDFKLYSGERINEIGFAGSYNKTPWYTIRLNAVDTLAKNSLLSENAGRFGLEEYVYYIAKYKGILGCSGGILHTPLAKMFECMLSGTPYLTNWFYGKHQLFGLKEYCFIYKDDCSDIVKKAKIILNDTDYVNEVTTNAYQIVNEHHTDEARLNDLYTILKHVVAGKEPPRKWGK